MRTAISTDRLTKHFGSFVALRDLTLDVPLGSIYGFLGANGSGKTTTLRMLAGLSRPTSGSATVNGVEVTPAGRHRRHLGFLSQEPKFYRWMTGRQVLNYVARFFGPVDDRHINFLLERTGIADAADRKTKNYSGGMRQRLGIAQALVGRPTLLMLDEPASALDPVGRAEVLSLMNELKGETTIFFSTHILEDVQRCSDYVAILDHGRLLTASNTAELLASFTKGRLRVVMTGKIETRTLQAIPGVASVAIKEPDADKWAFDLMVEEGTTRAVQRTLTRMAADNGFALLECEEVRLNLESVFLKLIGQEDEREGRRPKKRRRDREDD